MVYRLVRATKEEASIKPMSVAGLIRVLLKSNSQPVLLKVTNDDKGPFIAVRPKKGNLLEIDEEVMKRLAKVMRERKIPLSLSVNFTETPRSLKIYLGESK